MWTITTDLMKTEDGLEYTAYGIAGEDCTIPDISTDKEAILEFVDRLNKFGASPIHAVEIVENFLAEM